MLLAAAAKTAEMVVAAQAATSCPGPRAKGATNPHTHTPKAHCKPIASPLQPPLTTRPSLVVSSIRNISLTATLTTSIASLQSSQSRIRAPSATRSTSGAPTTTSASRRSRTLTKYGAGAGGTRNIAGNGQIHLALEEELATLHRKPAALVFSSCYVATLGGRMPDCVIFSDGMNHASMIQGIRHSQARKVIFKHNEMADLEQKLAQFPKETPKIIAFESVYSMCGSVAPIEKICDLAEEYGAITFLDEVHAVGCTDLAAQALRSISTLRHTSLPGVAHTRSRERPWIGSTSSPARLARRMVWLEVIPQVRLAWWT